MSPTEFVVRRAAADGRFEHAQKCDDVPEVRAPLAEKTELPKHYYAVPQRHAHNETRRSEIRRPVSVGHFAVIASARFVGPRSPADAR